MGACTAGDILTNELFKGESVVYSVTTIINNFISILILKAFLCINQCRQANYIHCDLGTSYCKPSFKSSQYVILYLHHAIIIYKFYLVAWLRTLKLSLLVGCTRLIIDLEVRDFVLENWAIRSVYGWLLEGILRSCSANIKYLTCLK